jgi:predicted DNA-binding protein (MmcQ/YjbR family)
MAGSLRDQVSVGCSAKPGSVKDHPLADQVAVFKVGGRMFAVVPWGPGPAMSASNVIRGSQ